MMHCDLRLLVATALLVVFAVAYPSCFILCFHVTFHKVANFSSLVLKECMDMDNRAVIRALKSILEFR